MIVASPAFGTVSSTSAQFGGTNGRVNAIIRVANTVYVGGSFTQVTGNNGTTANRSNLAAFNLSGNVLPFAPNPNAEVRALASNGKRLFVGGAFTSIHGQAAARLAAISLVVGGRYWGGGADGVVRTVKLDRSRLLVGGVFKKVQGKTRHRFASLNPTTGRLGTWAPDFNQIVDAIAVGPHKVFVGGEFKTVNGKKQTNLVAFSNTTNALVPFAHPSFPVFALGVSGNLYVGGSGSGGWLSSFTPTGHRNWALHLDGGVQALSVTTNQIIAGGHFNNWCQGGSGSGSPVHCTTPVSRPKLLAANPGNGAVQAWHPAVDSPLGVFATRTSHGTLFVGGDFSKIGPDPRSHLGSFTYS